MCAAKYEGTCAEAMVEVSEGQANAILCLNIFFPSFGTLCASCCNKGGCNWKTFGLSLLQGVLTGIIIGWIWGIMWALEVKNWNAKNAGGAAEGGE